MAPVPRLLSLVLLGIAACASWQVSSEPRSGVDFTRYRTFAWVPWSELPPPDAGMQNVAIATWLEAAIDAELVAKGLARNDAAPDLKVTFRVGVTDALGATQWGYGYGARDGSFSPGNARDGALVVDIADARTKERVWLGVAHGSVPTGADRDERLRAVVRDLLAAYPR